MRRYVSWTVVAAVSATALAATVDALVAREPAPGRKLLAARTIHPQAGEVRRRTPPCDRRQLEFGIDITDMPAAVLEHVNGAYCRRPDLPLDLRILPAAGEPEGEIFGPEGVLGGTFSPGEERVAAFRYRPTCAERGPFVAVAVTGGFAARGEIPTEEPCFPAVERKVVALGLGREADVVRVEAPDPGTHTFTVQVALPHTAQVTISMWDPLGAVIRVLDDEIDHRGCHRRGKTALCVYHFPTIETHSPGEWRVSMRKTSAEPATVRFQIAFEAIR